MSEQSSSFRTVRNILAFIVVAFALGVACGWAMGYKWWYTSPAFALVQKAIITRVVDGDTLDVKVGDMTLTVRLMGIQAPETNQCFGSEATAKLQAHLGKKVKIEFLPPPELPILYDMYGRRALAYLYVNGENFNLKMIREGYAHEFTNSGTYEHRSEFQEAHCAARAQKKGLWATEECGQQSLKGRKRACLR